MGNTFRRLIGKTGAFHRFGEEDDPQYTLDCGKNRAWICAAEDYELSSGRVILLFYGRGGDVRANNLNSNPSGNAFRKRLAASGAMLVCPDCGANSFGSENGSRIALAALAALPEAGIAVPGRVPLLGFSMGGLNCLMFAARHPEHVCAVFDVFGITDLTAMVHEVPQYLEAVRREGPGEDTDGASPIRFADTLRRLPVHIYHGQSDQIVNIRHSRNLAAALAPAGNCTLREVPGVRHDNVILDSVGDDILDRLLPLLPPIPVPERQI